MSKIECQLKIKIKYLEDKVESLTAEKKADENPQVDTIQPTHEHLLQFELNKAEAKISELEEELSSKLQENEEMVRVQHQLIKANLPPTSFSRKT